MIEFNDILKRLDVSEKDIKEFTEGDKKIEDFNEMFSEKWIARDMVGEDKELVNGIFGKKIGTVTTDMSKRFDLKKSETKDLKIEEIIELAGTKVDERSQILVDELNKLKDNSNDDQLKDLQKKEDDWKEEKGKFEQGVLDHNQAIVDLKDTHAGELKGFKLDSEVKAIEGRVDFHTEVNDMTKKGFMATMKENYKINFNDKDLLEITDLQGEKIKNENGTSTLSVSEVYDREASENKLLKQNQADPDQKVNTPAPPTPDPNAHPERKLHGDTAKHEIN